MDKILSIIIPTYNMQRYLDKCLTSLIIEDKELLKQLEVLVIIDGATDDSANIAKNYQKHYPQTFSVIEKENGNYGSCINRGLQHITGKYVKVLDADDYYDTTEFELYLRKLNKIDTDLVINEFVIVDESYNRTGKWWSFENTLPMEKDMTFDELIGYGYAPFSCMHVTAYKTEIFKNMQFHQSEGISYTDQEWVFMPMSGVKTAHYINSELYMYLIGREGQTMSKVFTQKQVDNLNTVIFKMISIYEKSQCSESLKTYYLERIKSIMVWSFYLFRLEQQAITEEQLCAFDKRLNTEYPDLYNLTHKWFMETERLQQIERWRYGRIGFLIHHPSFIRNAILKRIKRIVS